MQGYAPDVAAFYVNGTVGGGAFNVGELWSDMAWSGSSLDVQQDAARQTLCDYIDATGSLKLPLFDFPTKGILQVAVQGQLWRLRDAAGKPPGLLGWWPSRAVTFIDNHDTGALP